MLVGRVAGVEGMRAIFLDHGRLANQFVGSRIIELEAIFQDGVQLAALGRRRPGTSPAGTSARRSRTAGTGSENRRAMTRVFPSLFAEQHV